MGITIFVLFFFILLMIGAFVAGLIAVRRVTRARKILNALVVEHSLVLKDKFLGPKGSIGLDPQKNVIVVVRANFGKVYPVSKIQRYSIESDFYRGNQRYCLVLHLDDFDYPVWKFEQLHTAVPLERIAGKIEYLWKRPNGIPENELKAA